MKIPCPHCSQSLTLPERFAGKVTKCPACQKSFEVPGPDPGTEAAAAPQSNMTPALPKASEMALDGLMQQNTKQQDGPPELHVCPACNKEWKKGATECKNCHYNVFIGGKVRKPPKRSMNFHVDAQQVFLYLFIAGVIYGGYWLYNGGWNWFSKGVNKTFDDAARGHPTEDDDTVAKRKKPESNN